MRKREYRVSVPGNPDFILATYQDGELYALEGIHKLGQFWESVCINAPIPLQEKDIPHNREHYKGMVLIEKVQGSGTGDKIAMFCAAYKKHLGINYRHNYGDPRLIADIDVTPELLDLYFTNKEWWGKQPKHIRNLAKNYNALLQLQAAPAVKPKAGIEFPDEWDKNFESKLKGNQLTAYWKHLRKLGLKAEKDAMGNTIKWVKITAVLAILIILLGSCMTPKKVQRYLADNPQLLPAPQVDTVFETVTLEEIDTIYLPEKTQTTEWEWSWGDAEDKDSTWYEGSLFDLMETKVTARDTSINSRPVTKFKVVTTVKSDTLYLLDTVTVEKQVINTRTVIVKPKSWTRYIPWVLGAILIIGLLWQRKQT